MSFEILNNPIPEAIDFNLLYEDLRRDNPLKYPVITGTKIRIDINKWKGYFPFKNMKPGTITATVIDSHNGILIEFPKGSIRGHHGDIDDNSTDRWWL